MPNKKTATFKKTYQIEGGNFQAAGSVSKRIKLVLKQLNIDPEIIWRSMIVAYEAEMNVVLYAEKADVTLKITPKKIHITFSDEGPGIPDIGKAMTEGYSTATREMRERGFGAGLGLPNIKKTADKLDIKTTVGQGTELNITLLIQK